MGPMPMPARERFYPGTEWVVSDLPEVPLDLRNVQVVVFTELQQEEETGYLYTHVYPKESDPINDLYKVDLSWLE